MSRILFHGTLSPPSRAALLTVRSLGLENKVQIKAVDTFKGEQNTPEFLKINPLHQIPVYAEGDFILTESRAIATFLASSAKSNLYPGDLRKRALVDSKLYFDATNSFPVIRDIVVSKLISQFKDKKYIKLFQRPVLRAGAKTISKERRDAVKTLLQSFESFLEKSEWFAGEEITLADVTILANVASIKAWNVDLAKYPNLNNWYSRCRTFPGFAENEEGAEALAEKVSKLLEEPLWS